MVKLQVQGCHPGYKLDQDSHTCVCDHSNSIIVQCDINKRYFYARVGGGCTGWRVEGVDGASLVTFNCAFASMDVGGVLDRSDG